MLQILRVLPMLLVALILRADRKILRRLQSVSATDPQRAIEIERGGLVWNWRLDRLAGAGALRQVSPGRYCLDETGWSAYRRTRRTRMLTVAAILVIVLLFFAWKAWL